MGNTKGNEIEDKRFSDKSSNNKLMRATVAS